jgi:predicted nuclease of restriction endonuclease-like (RecB) superfamily
MAKKKRTSPPAPLRRGEGSKKSKTAVPSVKKNTTSDKPLSRGRGVAEGRGEVLFERIRRILESARVQVARSVNTTQVVANWLVGREIVEEEQHGRKRAQYGRQEMAALADKLQSEFGSGYSVQNLRYMRQFYLQYPELIDGESIHHAVRGEFMRIAEQGHISDASLRESVRKPTSTQKRHAARGESDDSWKPGTLSPNLSWTHYRALLKVKRREARDFYEIEAAKNKWSARELERQINSLLFERLLKSRDKKGVKALANKGLEPENPIDTIKDPYVLEFLDLPESHRLVESKLEDALITRLADFLLELGTGFAFVARQQRLTLDGDHYYSDLVFYHVKLKCYLVIDLKTAKLTHGDLGQMQMYVGRLQTSELSNDG